MRRVPQARRLVALLAAYAMVLQAFLPLASLAAGVGAGQICATSSNASPAPVGDTAPCGCAAGCGTCCSLAGFMPPARFADVHSRTAQSATLTFARVAFDLPTPRHRPQAPRPPPAA